MSLTLSRPPLRRVLILLFAAITLTSGVAVALDMTPHPVGRWKFKKNDKPIKVVLIGGSMSVGRSSYGGYLQAVCQNVELKNKSRIGYGSPQLYGRFKRQVIRNRRIDLKDERFKYWLLYNGGMNSIGYPEGTIAAIASTYVLAHKHGMKVVGLSLTPWGAKGSRSWRGAKGLIRHTRTRKVVDYTMGRLKRIEALGARAKGRDEWLPTERPDVGIDLYDSELRQKNAELRNREKMLKVLRRSKKARAMYPTLEAAVDRAVEVPRWFMKKELRGFDHVHPNKAGQKLIAITACQKLPESWGCECERLQRMSWKRRKGFVVSE